MAVATLLNEKGNCMARILLDFDSTVSAKLGMTIMT